MKRSLRAGIQGVLVVGLAVSTGCSGPIDQPLEISQQALDDTSWYFWNYHANFPYAFYGNCPANSNSCTNGCDYNNESQQVYAGGPFNGYDLDWSGGHWVRGAQIRLPVDAQYVDYSNLTVTCTDGSGTGTEWIPRFRQIKSDGSLGQAFLFNHLQHSSISGNSLITKGVKYNAGTLIGYEGGSQCNEGNGIWNKIRISSGTHGCMVTAPPAAPCSFLPHGHVPASSCHNENGSTANPISACATVTVVIQQGTGTVQVFRNSQLIDQTSVTKKYPFKVNDGFTFFAVGSGGQTFQKFCDDLACTITTTQNPFSGTITVSSGFMRTYFQ